MSLKPSRRGARISAIALLAALGAAAAGTAAMQRTGDQDHPTPPPAKAAVVQRVEDFRKNAGPPAERHPHGRVAVNDLSRPSSLGKIRTTDLQAPVSPVQFVPTSMWVDWRDGKQIAVYAGTLRGSDPRGALFVWETNINDNITALKSFFTPESNPGALTVTKVTGNTVYFSAPRGGGTFDLVTNSFGG